MAKITIDDFEIPDSDTYSPTSQNLAYDRILQLSYDQSAYTPQPTRCPDTASAHSEMNKYFTIDINKLCKSLHCTPFNQTVSTSEKDGKYFSPEQLRAYEEEAYQSRKEFERGADQRFIGAKEIEMFKDLMVSQPGVESDEAGKSAADNNMDDWLDDLLN
jgi:hypothetical protein